MKTSIVIPVYNNANFTKAALDDLVLLGEDNEIVVVDNGSTDHTFDVVQDANNRSLEDGMNNNSLVFQITNKENLGFAKANNQGFDWARGEYVLFLNNDIRVKGGQYFSWLNQLIELCDDDCIVGAQSGMIDRDYNFVKEGQFDPMQKGAYLSGWCIMAKRSTWEKLKLDDKRGPWNEAYFLYFEDDDLSWRAKQAGMKLKVVQDLPLIHFSRTTGRKYNMFHYFHKSRRIFKRAWKGKLV